MLVGADRVVEDRFTLVGADLVVDDRFTLVGADLVVDDRFMLVGADLVGEDLFIPVGADLVGADRFTDGATRFVPPPPPPLLSWAPPPPPPPCPLSLPWASADEAIKAKTDTSEIKRYDIFFISASLSKFVFCEFTPCFSLVMAYRCRVRV
jgi:hypothetical protein